MVLTETISMVIMSKRVGEDKESGSGHVLGFFFLISI